MPAPVSLDLSNPLVFTGMLLVALASLLSMAVAVSNLWRNFRRNPPVDDIFATKAEVKALEERSNTRASDNRRAVEALESHLKGNITDLERRVTASITDNRTVAENHFATHQTQLTNLTNCVSNLYADLNRAIGRLEGASAALHAAAVKVATQGANA